MEVWKVTRMRYDGTWYNPNKKQIMVSKKITSTSILIDLKVIFLFH